MNATGFEASPGDETASNFRATLDTLPRPLFAVLDGGQFDDIEDELAEVGIAGRSLFLRGGDDDIRRDGPWLVALDNNSTSEYLEELVSERPCAVFWSCPEGEQALWKHLRSINEIMIPDQRVPDMNDTAAPKYERVLFRHWDSSALNSMLRQLDADQFVRLFGPAEAILINVVGDGGLTRAMRPEGASAHAPGLLTIRPEQLEAIDDRSRKKYCNKMTAILREMAPQETAAISEEELNERVLRYEASGNRMGLTQERSLSLWGFLMFMSGEQFETQPEIRGYLQSDAGTPDENVETLFNQITRLFGTMDEAG